MPSGTRARKHVPRKRLFKALEREEGYGNILIRTVSRKIREEYLRYCKRHGTNMTQDLINHMIRGAREQRYYEKRKNDEVDG